MRFGLYAIGVFVTGLKKPGAEGEAGRCYGACHLDAVDVFVGDIQDGTYFEHDADAADGADEVEREIAADVGIHAGHAANLACRPRFWLYLGLSTERIAPLGLRKVRGCGVWELVNGGFWGISLACEVWLICGFCGVL